VFSLIFGILAEARKNPRAEIEIIPAIRGELLLAGLNCGLGGTPLSKAGKHLVWNV
jgi:hypothetical protein